MSRRADYATLAALAAGSLVVLHACASARTLPPVPDSGPLVLVDGRCTVVTLRHDSGVEESLCMSASDLKNAYDMRAGRDGGCR